VGEQDIGLSRWARRERARRYHRRERAGIEAIRHLRAIVREQHEPRQRFGRERKQPRVARSPPLVVDLSERAEQRRRRQRVERGAHAGRELRFGTRFGTNGMILRDRERPPAEHGARLDETRELGQRADRRARVSVLDRPVQAGPPHGDGPPIGSGEHRVDVRDGEEHAPVGPDSP
jgi:hypothetical protein